MYGNYNQGMRCPVCNTAIDLDKPYFASSAFGHRYSDAAIHWSCFYSMNDWEEFLERSFNISVSEIESNPYWNILYKTKDYMISSDSVNVNVQLKPGGMSFSTHISKWPENLGLFIGKLDINYLSENQRKEVAVLLKQATRYQIKN